MNKQEFRELVNNQRLILDGGTGSNLVKRGNMPSGVCPEKWILDNPEIMIGLQVDYLKAGSNVIYAPTFTANRVKLAEYGLDANLEQMNRDLVEISREAIRRAEAMGITGPHYIAADISMTGQQLEPMGTMKFEELVDVYKQQLTVLIDAGVDLIAFETMMSLQECRCGVIAAKELCDLPITVTMTFEESGRSLYGTEPLTALITLQSLGVSAFGINCGTGPDKIEPLILDLIKYAKIPIICKPNAGLPSLTPEGKTVYSMDPSQFVDAMKNVFANSVSILGGCCGTAPEYIELMVNEANKHDYNPPFASINPAGDAECFNHSDYKGALCSERQNFLFDLDSPFIIVGERINPTGKKALQQQLREGCFDIVKEFAEQQEEHGAQILDVNMGMGDIDEKEIMLKAIESVAEVSNLPISIDTSDPDVMEAALRRYPGRALVNSVSLEKVKIERILPLVKKYGAMMILLPLSDKGLPESFKEKMDIIHEILGKCDEMGISRSDIIVDGLVTTIGANKQAALETLETIRYCHDELHLATTCGLSNISFGLPERSFVNASFLTMAISSGLTMAISNPNQDLLANTAFAVDLLRNKTGADIKYIDQINARKDELDAEGAFISLYGGKKIRPGVDKDSATASGVGKGKAENDKNSGEAGFSPEEASLYKAVLKGNRDGVIGITKTALDSGTNAKRILDDILLPAINKVGFFFDQGRYFLPQLIASAETMEKSISYIEPLLKDAGGDTTSKGTIVVATVEGDIHDIGKNLVVLMLKNYGFKVFDLGKDVKKEAIVQAAIRENADIIALSALMTTTMKQMELVVKYARECGCGAKVMIGGAVTTQEYADSIGADGYSEDAASAVKLAQRLIDDNK